MSEAADDVLSSISLMTEANKLANKLAVHFVKNETSYMSIQSLTKEFNNGVRMWTVSSPLYNFLQNIAIMEPSAAK